MKGDNSPRLPRLTAALMSDSKNKRMEKRSIANRLSSISDRLTGRQSRSPSSAGPLSEAANANNHEAEYEQFLSDSSALWTIIDQQRLVALNGLHHRMLEYHNNIHVKESALNHVSAIDAEDNRELMVVQAVKYSNIKVEKPTSVTFGDLQDFCAHCKQDLEDDKDSIVWIHMRDLLALETIGKAFEIHELLTTGFQDLRAHSSFLPAFGEVLLTIVTCMRENNDFNMYKMYIYISERVIITFQAELLPDIMDPELSSPDKLVATLFQNYMALRTQCLRYGTIYLMYEIAMLSLKALDSSMEFVSYGLSYFNKVVHLRLLHRERLSILVKMHMVSSGIRFFRGLIEEGSANILKFVETAVESNDRNPTGLGRILHTDLLHEHHIPYLVDLSDSFAFVMTSLRHQMDESLRLETELEATMQMRATNTSIVLSLIATIFLPMTFIAGVFGMNFQVNGNSSIGMLNVSYGPTLFYLMCAVSAVVSITFFISQGWLEFGIFGRLSKQVWCAPRIDDGDGDSDEEVEALKRAQQEESRRREQADARRSFQQATRSVERVMNYRASNMGSGRGTLSHVRPLAPTTTIQQAHHNTPQSHNHSVSSTTSASTIMSSSSGHVPATGTTNPMLPKPVAATLLGINNSNDAGNASDVIPGQPVVIKRRRHSVHYNIGASASSPSSRVHSVDAPGRSQASLASLAEEDTFLTNSSAHTDRSPPRWSGRTALSIGPDFEAELAARSSVAKRKDGGTMDMI